SIILDGNIHATSPAEMLGALQPIVARCSTRADESLAAIPTSPLAQPKTSPAPDRESHVHASAHQCPRHRTETNTAQSAELSAFTIPSSHTRNLAASRFLSLPVSLPSHAKSSCVPVSL